MNKSLIIKGFIIIILHDIHKILMVCLQINNSCSFLYDKLLNMSLQVFVLFRSSHNYSYSNTLFKE